MKKQRKTRAIHLKITPVVSLGLLSLTSCSSFDENRLVCIDSAQNNKIVSKQLCQAIEEQIDRKIKDCNTKFSSDSNIDNCCKQVESEAKAQNNPYKWYYMEKTPDEVDASTPDGQNYVRQYHSGFIFIPPVHGYSNTPQSHFSAGQVSDVGKPHSTISRSGFVSKSGGYISVSRGGFGGRGGFSS